MSLDVFDMAESLFSDYYGEDVYITKIINDFYEFKNDSRAIFKYLKANHIDLDFNGYERTLSDLKKLDIIGNDLRLMLVRFWKSVNRFLSF